MHLFLALGRISDFLMLPYFFQIIASPLISDFPKPQSLTSISLVVEEKQFFYFHVHPISSTLDSLSIQPLHIFSTNFLQYLPSGILFHETHHSNKRILHSSRPTRDTINGPNFKCQMEGSFQTNLKTSEPTLGLQPLH